MWWTLGNNTLAVLGSYLAAYLVDRKWMGRTRMQCECFTLKLNNMTSMRSNLNCVGSLKLSLKLY